MIAELRKLHLIEEVLKIDSDSTLEALELFLKKISKKTPSKSYTESDFAEFSGIWAKEEAIEYERIIEEACEKINPDDWK